MVHTLKLYLICMFKVRRVVTGRKALSEATCREIDLAQFWRQQATAKEVVEENVTGLKAFRPKKINCVFPAACDR
ncbi:MAG TPA: hypothetical protein DDY57_01720 [Franconibacter pulveris]|nr:hypothetical protein [Franconibacter pulveris]